jgi:membrane-associated phospholipid phosphatase
MAYAMTDSIFENRPSRHVGVACLWAALSWCALAVLSRFGKPWAGFFITFAGFPSGTASLWFALMAYAVLDCGLRLRRWGALPSFSGRRG